MKKIISALLLIALCLSLLASCGASSPVPSGSEDADRTEKTNGSNETEETNGTEGPGTIKELDEAKEFTAVITALVDDEGIEFCLPEDHEGNLFTDCGVNCMVTAESFGNDVVAYHEFDNQGTIVKKTVGNYTFDYQAFDNYGISNWKVFVIRFASTERPNQMEHRYYKIVYNAYGEKYPESQVEKFMQTIRLPWEEKN